MQQQSTWERLAPLTGVAFVVIAVIAFAIGGSTPGDHDTAQQVQTFYGKHHDKHMLLSFILALSIPFLLFFVSSLRYELRRAGGTGQLANAAFGGGVLAAAGFGILAFVHWRWRMQPTAPRRSARPRRSTCSTTTTSSRRRPASGCWCLRPECQRCVTAACRNGWAGRPS